MNHFGVSLCVAVHLGVQCGLLAQEKWTTFTYDGNISRNTCRRSWSLFHTEMDRCAKTTSDRKFGFEVQVRRKIIDGSVIYTWTYVIIRCVRVFSISNPSVCLSSVCLSSVTFVCLTQSVETFGNISNLFCTLAVCWRPSKV